MVVTTTSTVPAAAAEGAVAVICVLESMLKSAATLPKVTLTAPRKSVPVMTTLSLPAVEPEVVPRLVTAGAGSV